MSDKNTESVVQIGVKLADGSFFPVFNENFRGSKKLLLTTVRDNQESVQIDLFKGMDKEVFDDAYIGTLVIENLPPAPKGEPEINLVIGIDPEGNLQAEAVDARSGERQTLSVSLESLSDRSDYNMPDFELEPVVPVTTVETEAPEQTIAGETYPVGEGDRRKAYLKKPKSGASPGRVILIIVLVALLLGGIGVGVYFLLPWFQSVLAGQPVALATASPSPSPAESAAASSSSSPEEASSSSSQESSTAKTEGTWYVVVKGDTLWDISRQYYRDPYQYMRIANAPENNIKNPDLILEKQRIFIPNN